MIVPLLSLALIALGITLIVVAIIMQQVRTHLSPAALPIPRQRPTSSGSHQEYPPSISYALQEQVIIIMTGCELIQCCAVTFYQG